VESSPLHLPSSHFLISITYLPFPNPYFLDLPLPADGARRETARAARGAAPTLTPYHSLSPGFASFCASEPLSLRASHSIQALTLPLSLGLTFLLPIPHSPHRLSPSPRS